MIFGFIFALTNALSWGLLISIFVRERYRHGTYERYVWASIGWVCLPAMWINVILRFIRGPEWIDYFGVVSTAFITYIMITRDDDDNYWKRKRKQFTRWFKSLSVSSPKLAPNLW